MLIIRKEQLDILAKVPREDFYGRIARNVRQLFPSRVAEMGFEKTMELIRTAATAAESAGFVTESELALTSSGFLKFWKTRLSRP